jgi:integrase
MSAPPKVGHGPRLSELQKLYTADRKGELSAKSLKHIPPAFAGLTSFAGDVPVDSIERSTVSNWVRDLAERLEPSSVNRTLRVMSSAWTWCVDHGKIRADTPSPFSRLSRKVDAEGTKYQPFEIDELQRLLEPSPIRNHILVGLYSGMRCSEITASKLVEISGVLCFEISSGKTDAAARRVPVHPALLAAGVTGWHKSLSRLLGDTVSKRFIRWRRACGITTPKKVFHSLRANFTTALESADVPQSTAKLLVGHKRRDMTYGHYSSGPGLMVLADAVGKVSYKGLRLPAKL